MENTSAPAAPTLESDCETLRLLGRPGSASISIAELAALYRRRSIPETVSIEDAQASLQTLVWRDRRALEAAWKKAARPVRARVRAAFSTLRRGGFYAKASYLCCSSCACADMAVAGKVAHHQPVAYFTKQDAEAFDQGGDLRRAFYIRYGVWTGDEPSDDARTEAAGCLVRDALRAQGLTVEWNGKADQAIRVLGVALGDGAALASR